MYIIEMRNESELVVKYKTEKAEMWTVQFYSHEAYTIFPPAVYIFHHTALHRIASPLCMYTRRTKYLIELFEFLQRVT